MGKKLIICLALILLLTPLINASPAVTRVQQFTEGYVIIGTPSENLLENEEFTYNFFLFNISNGRLLDDTDINCTFYLTNITGDVITSGDVSYTTYWNYVVESSYLKKGIYDYGIECHSLSFGGTTTGSLQVNSVGTELTTARAIIYLSLFGVLIFLFTIVTLGAFSFPSENNFSEDNRVVSLSRFKYLRYVLFFIDWLLLISIFFISSNLAFAYLGETLFANFFFVLYRILFGLTPIMFILWFIRILMMIIEDKKLKALLERGFEVSKGDKL